MRRTRAALGIAIVASLASVPSSGCIPVEPTDDQYGGLEVIEVAKPTVHGFVTDDGWTVTLDDVRIPLTGGINRFNDNRFFERQFPGLCVGDLDNGGPPVAQNLVFQNYVALTKRVDVGRCSFAFETSVVRDEEERDVASALVAGSATDAYSGKTMRFRFMLSLGGAPYGCDHRDGVLKKVTIAYGEKVSAALVWTPEELFRDGPDAGEGRLRFGPIAVADLPDFDFGGGDEDGIVTSEELDELEIQTVRRYGMPFDASSRLPPSIHMLSFVASRGTLAWSLSSGEECYSLDRSRSVVDPFE